MFWNLRMRTSPLGRTRLRLAFIILGTVFIVDFFNVAFSRKSPRRVEPLSIGQTIRHEKIFIASIHRNSEYILRNHWNEAVLNLTAYFGRENVYVSVYESGSQDGTKDALRDLDFKLKELGIGRSIVLGKSVEEQIEEVSNGPDSKREGWIFTPRGSWELRRVPYLATLRNKVMEKLDAQAAIGRTYDVILWLNDVVFTTEDIVTLLATREGYYDAVCSLDFSVSPNYYDTFALRDYSGAKTVRQIWPYFLSSVSRDPLMSNLPVPVQSCWNGIVAFKAEPFYASPPLRFRGVSDSLAKHHLEGSECCLIHADYHRDDSYGVWLNPNVRVGYTPETYSAVNPSRSTFWPSPKEKIKGMWGNRLGRWFGWLKRATEKWHIESEVRLWRLEQEGNTEEALHCLINEMQVLFESGWQHV